MIASQGIRYTRANGLIAHSHVRGTQADDLHGWSTLRTSALSDTARPRQVNGVHVMDVLNGPVLWEGHRDEEYVGFRPK
jgi:hypothetical protein